MLEYSLLVLVYFICNVSIIVSLLDMLKEECRTKKQLIISLVLLFFFGTILAFMAIIYHVFEVITGRSE